MSVNSWVGYIVVYSHEAILHRNENEHSTTINEMWRSPTRRNTEQKKPGTKEAVWGIPWQSSD